MKDIAKQIIIKLLRIESKAILKKYKPQIVGITGTVGKTSTKEAVYAVLSEFEYVRRSPKSYNSELGIPLTIIGAKNPGNDLAGWVKVLLEGLLHIILPSHYPKWLVLEVGTDRPGDISEATEIMKPDIVIVTKLSRTPVHVENFASLEDLFEEKGNLVRSLKPGGTLILNADDEDVVAYRTFSDERIILFGNSAGSDVRADNYEIVYDDGKRARGVQFDIYMTGKEDKSYPVFVEGTLGESHSYHALAAMATAQALGEDLAHAAKSLSRLLPTAGRLRLIDGLKESTIIDDTYNSSPVAVEEALKALKSVKGKRKIAILGDMLELGRFTVDEHRRAGERAAKVADILAVVGIRSRYSAEAALNAGMSEKVVYQFDESIEAGKFLKDAVQKGDVILVKGSQGMRMEKAVLELMAHPEDKEKLLVRQDAEWKNR